MDPLMLGVPLVALVVVLLIRAGRGRRPVRRAGPASATTTDTATGGDSFGGHDCHDASGSDGGGCDGGGGGD